MISISSVQFDLDGHIILRNTGRSNLTASARRVSRSATLDGGASIPDMGFAHGDRTMNILVDQVTVTVEEAVRYLHRTYPLVVLTCRDGGFLGVISSVGLNAGALNLTFLVKEKLTED